MACAVLVFARPATAAEIDACKYLLVSDITPDPYAIVSELRTQGKAVGFLVVTAPSEIPDADQFRTCLMVGRWLGGAFSGQLAIRVVDSATGAPVAAANLSATNWWGIGRTVRASVEEIYRQIGYTGYKEDVYKARIARLYPPRPKVAITESDVKTKTPDDRLQGRQRQPVPARDRARSRGRQSGLRRRRPAGERAALGAGTSTWTGRGTTSVTDGGAIAKLTKRSGLRGAVMVSTAARVARTSTAAMTQQ